MPDRTGRLVVMGVAGSGKSTVAAELGRRLGVKVVDADDHHPPANVEKMAAGVALTDADRAPWLQSLRTVLAADDEIVVSCSALKRSYRDVLRQAGGVRFVLLDVDRETARRRVAERVDHFMGLDMVDGQFATLEPPAADEFDVAVIDATGSVASIVDCVVGGDTVTPRQSPHDRK